jgi:hypothetical protein
MADAHPIIIRGRIQISFVVPALLYVGGHAVTNDQEINDLACIHPARSKCKGTKL